MKRIALLLTLISISACTKSCGSHSSPRTVPKLNPDRAYQRILEYERFGPKTPGSQAHMQAGNWMVNTLRSLGLDVIEQTGEWTSPQTPSTPIRNIIARLNPHLKKRILLSAHWDNRPFADQDEFQKRNPFRESMTEEAELPS